MSTYSLDSLDQESNAHSKSMGVEVDFAPQIVHDNAGAREDKKEDLTDNSSKDNEFNESSSVTISTSGKRELVKFCGNSIIASKEFCSRVEKLPGTLSRRSHFRTGRSVQKKFNVPRRSSSSLSSSSSTEFRHGTASLLTRKRPEDVTEFMKADKKPGNVKPDILVVDKHKKPVSYLQLYRTRFGVDSRQCIDSPVGSSPSICDDGSDEQTAQKIDSSPDLSGFSRDENSEVVLHPRALQLDKFATNETAECDAIRADDSVESFHDDVQPKNRTRRVVYEPYDIEDYKSLSVPRADRSLGPDRNEMESKGEWLMRRRTYGDSVSALNRERILRRAEKLKHSRRVDSQKLLLQPTSTDLKHPGPASKIDGMLEQTESITPTRSFSRTREQTDIKQRERAARITKKSSNVSKNETTSFLPKRKTKIVNSTRALDSNFYETSSNTADDDSMHLKNLRNRHLEEKKMIDRILKVGLSAH